MSGVPLTDAPSLRRIALRTDVVRFALAASLLVLLGTIASLAGHPRARTVDPLPAGSTAIVVLDLSASVSRDTYSMIGAALSQLASSEGRYGLVIFSESAYEALPPNIPAAELKSLIRYFTLPSQTAPGFIPAFPRNPWERAFSGGTRISSGLDLAHRLALGGDLHRPGVVLISDLSDDPGDLRRTALTILAYRRDHLPLRVVGLNPAPADEQFFRRLLGGNDAITGAPLQGEASTTPNQGGFPWVLAALALALILALAGNELLLARVTWKEHS